MDSTINLRPYTLGAKVVLACRSRERAEPVVAEIRQQTGNSDVEYKELDLCRLASVRAFAEDVGGGDRKVDVLINNGAVINFLVHFASQ